jgi:hypothetical protein
VAGAGLAEVDLAGAAGIVKTGLAGEGLVVFGPEGAGLAGPGVAEEGPIEPAPGPVDSPPSRGLDGDQKKKLTASKTSTTELTAKPQPNP